MHFFISTPRYVKGNQKSCPWEKNHKNDSDSTSYTYRGKAKIPKLQKKQKVSWISLGEAHFPCPICGETFLTTARRALHKKTHNQSTIDFSIIWSHLKIYLGTSFSLNLHWFWLFKFDLRLVCCFKVLKK